MSQRASAPGPAVLTVSELTRGIKRALAERFDDVWVRGEITSFKRAPSGHMMTKPSASWWRKPIPGSWPQRPSRRAAQSAR